MLFFKWPFAKHLTFLPNIFICKYKYNVLETTVIQQLS